MPELPEVETIVRTLRPTLVGLIISKVLFHRQDILEPNGTDLSQALTGRTIIAIERRGKRILTRLDNASTFIIHLGMTGQLTLAPIGTPHKPHTHLVLHFASPPIANRKLQIASPPTLRFRDPRRFGYLHLLPPNSPPDHNLGPEPLSLRPTQLAKLLSKTKRPLKSALLDQSLIAGLGNIYVDESLHHAHLHPLTPTHLLTPTQVSALNRSIKFILRRAINAKGSSLRDYVDATGLPGSAQSLHHVYSRKNKPCPTCKTPVERIVLSGRSTHFCPQCQKAPRPTR